MPVAVALCHDVFRLGNCYRDRCEETCIEKHGWKAVGFCDYRSGSAFCICDYPCSTNKMYTRSYDLSPLPSNPNSPQISSPDQIHWLYVWLDLHNNISLIENWIKFIIIIVDDYAAHGYVFMWQAWMKKIYLWWNIILHTK